MLTVRQNEIDIVNVIVTHKGSERLACRVVVFIHLFVHLTSCPSHECGMFTESLSSLFITMKSVIV